MLACVYGTFFEIKHHLGCKWKSALRSAGLFRVLLGQSAIGRLPRDD